MSYLSAGFITDVETCGLRSIFNSPGEYYAFNIYSWLTYLLDKYAHIHLPNGLMPANILVTHMSLGVSAKKISNTCMLHLLKKLGMRHYYYANFKLYHTYLGEFPKQQRSTTKRTATYLFTLLGWQWCCSTRHKQPQLGHLWVKMNLEVDWEELLQ